MKLKRIIAWLLCALLSAGMACSAEESAYESLCREHGLPKADLIAWLEIPGASLTQPIMRHHSNDAYYASHVPGGEEHAYGSLYVQPKYNAADFSDPVVLVYGSSAAEEAPFGMLQELYSGSFQSCRTLFLHTPEGTREYLVFAAIPYSSIHILHYYDFQSTRRYNNFFESVFSTRALGMHLDEDNRPAAGEDQVIILSTGLRGDSLQRYLVMAKQITPLNASH